MFPCDACAVSCRVRCRRGLSRVAPSHLCPRGAPALTEWRDLPLFGGGVREEWSVDGGRERKAQAPREPPINPATTPPTVSDEASQVGTEAASRKSAREVQKELRLEYTGGTKALALHVCKHFVTDFIKFSGRSIRQ